MSRENSKARVYTIGHSNHSLDGFFALLNSVSTEVLVDIRSSPYTKYSTHFNQSNLKYALSEAGLKYLYLGGELGGIPKDESFYDGDGHVLYWKLASTEPFQQAIERLCRGAETFNVVLLCAEENPAGCHRRLLVGKVLEARGIETLHIRARGETQSEEEILSLERSEATQLSIFGQGASKSEILNENSKEWKSAQAVLRK